MGDQARVYWMGVARHLDNHSPLAPATSSRKKISMKKLVLIILASFYSFVLFAQDTAAANADRQATGLRADGKIYVVLAVALTILFGLFIYLIRLDRKIARLEKSS